MNLFALSGLFIVSTCIVLIMLLLVYGRTRLHRMWIYFNLSIFVWGIGNFIAANASTLGYAVFGWRLGVGAGVYIATFFYHATLIFCDIKKRKFIVFAYLAPIVSNIFIYLDLAIPAFKFEYLFNSFYYPRGTIFYKLILLAWLIIVIVGFSELWRFLRKAKGTKREQAIYFFLGPLIGFFGGASVHLPILGIDLYPIGNFGIPIYCIIVTYAILRHRLMNIRVFISRAVAFMISYPLFLSIPFFFAYRMHPLIFPYLGMHWWLVPTGLVLFFATMAPVAYSQFTKTMENKLLAKQKRYQKLLLQAASGMTREHDVDRLVKLIVYIVKRIVKLRFAAIFLKDVDEGVYELKAMRDSGRDMFSGIKFLYEHPFIDYLNKNKDPFLYEELPVYMRNSITIPEEISLIVPFIMGDQLLGFVFLGEKLNQEAFNEDDINVFKILSNQVALAIENCTFIKEFKNAQERIFTAEKLASIGGMADGVAHQVKNRLNQFSVASGELKYEIKDFIKNNAKLVSKNESVKNTFEYIDKIADTMITNVKRTDAIIRGILEFARVEEKETFFSEFSLKEVVDLSAELLKVKHELAQVPLTIALTDKDTIYGVKAQITETIYNLLDNAFEAALEKKVLLNSQGNKDFEPSLSIKLTRKNTKYLIEISDNGIGIDTKDEKKIFSPFFTTKSSYKSGTGIGMYVVRRMVEENHKGKVWFTSRRMEGTKIFVELPKKSNKGVDLS